MRDLQAVHAPFPAQGDALAMYKQLFFFLKGVAPESGFHRNAKIARGMNPATPFPPSRVGAVQTLHALKRACSR